LNSQPMGFYAPAQLVQDVRRHGVEVRAVDVGHSGWDCALEEATPSPASRGAQPGEDARAPQPAVRLGLRLVKGLSRDAARRLEAARAQAPFVQVRDLVRRARLGRKDQEALAAAGALAGIAGNRHQARWQALGVEAPLPLLDGAEAAEAVPLLRAPTEGEAIAADYESLGLTLGRHPLALLRRRLETLGVVTAQGLRARRHGERLCIGGLVTGRQCPSSASGVIFVTLEDETGALQVIVWPRLAERQRAILLGARLLVVAGELQRAGEVAHVIARDLADHSALLGALAVRSRDFH
ncbi:MAG: helix-hairpin-helix domain-containing protein, partial [Gammaproteobacteria bacterium]